MSGETMTAEIEKRPLSMIVNGKEVGPIDVPVGMPMIEFFTSLSQLDRHTFRLWARCLPCLHRPRSAAGREAGRHPDLYCQCP